MSARPTLRAAQIRYDGVDPPEVPFGAERSQLQTKLERKKYGESDVCDLQHRALRKGIERAPQVGSANKFRAAEVINAHKHSVQQNRKYDEQVK